MSDFEGKPMSAGELVEWMANRRRGRPLVAPPRPRPWLIEIVRRKPRRRSGGIAGVLLNLHTLQFAALVIAYVAAVVAVVALFVLASPI